MFNLTIFVYVRPQGWRKWTIYSSLSVDHSVFNRVKWSSPAQSADAAAQELLVSETDPSGVLVHCPQESSRWSSQLFVNLHIGPWSWAPVLTSLAPHPLLWAPHLPGTKPMQLHFPRLLCLSSVCLDHLGSSLPCRTPPDGSAVDSELIRTRLWQGKPPPAALREMLVALLQPRASTYMLHEGLHSWVKARVTATVPSSIQHCMEWQTLPTVQGSNAKWTWFLDII